MQHFLPGFQGSKIEGFQVQDQKVIANMGQNT